MSFALNSRFSTPGLLSGSSNSASFRPLPRFRSIRHRDEVDKAIRISRGGQQRRRCVRVRNMEEDFVGFSSFDHGGVNDAAYYTISSSESEDSDKDYALNLVAETTAQRIDSICQAHKRNRIRYGMFINLGLISFLTLLLGLADCCAWKIVRLPLEPFYLLRPFFISAALVSCVGFFFVPYLDNLQLYQVACKHGSVGNSVKRKTPTMGGLFFVPIGAFVAKQIASSSIEVSGAIVATLAFAAIGFFHDLLGVLKSHRSGLSAWLRLYLEVAIGACFSFWLDATSISSPYGMKWIVPLPKPVGPISLEKFYFSSWTTFCFASMGNAISITDGADGLAGGISALAFAGMSIAVLPICQDLSVFGASMAGACVGFLLHNRPRASIVMGDTGSLALGGSLAAMAACSGMFLPLFVSTGFFVLEAFFVIIQVVYFGITKHFEGSVSRFSRLAAFHYQLELLGIKETLILGGAYVMSCGLALCAAYVGLISV